MMKKQAEDKISMGEAWKLNKRAFDLLAGCYPRTFLSAAVYAVVVAITPYVGIYLSAQIIGELAGARDSQVLTRLVVATVVATAVLALLSAVLLRWKTYHQSDLYYKYRKIYTDKMLSMDFSSIDDQKTHDLYSQIQQDERWNGWGLGQIIEYFESFVNAIISIGSAVLLTYSLFTQWIPAQSGGLTVLNHPLFVVLMIVLLGAAALLSPLCSNLATEYWTKCADTVKLGNRYFNYFSCLAERPNRSLDMRIYRQVELCNYYATKEKLFTPDSTLAHYARGPMGGWKALAAAISAVFTGMVYCFVCLKAWGGAFGVGSVTQYIGAITALSAGLGLIIETFGNMRSNASFLRTTFAFLDIPNLMYQGSLTTEKRADGNYEVEFRDVSFRYPATDTYQLRHVSIKFRIGERLAVVGQNGSGKTTFIKLLCRLYDPTEGEILLNGINIRKYDYNEYMSIFAVVFQDFKLFSYPVGQNVAASWAYDPEKTAQCLQKVGFGERLERMPHGLDSCLYRDFDINGTEVSGGEAQKIAIARALYKEQAAFLILDEPTAALDPIAEHEVYTNFNQLIGNKTAIYISHRLSSCRFCDNIVVFDQGNVVQQGSHDQLVGDTDGKYYELWHAQAQYYI